MTLGELLDRLKADHGIVINDTQVRYAWKVGKMTRPMKNGSGGYDYVKWHYDALVALFKGKAKKK